MPHFFYLKTVVVQRLQSARRKYDDQQQRCELLNPEKLRNRYVSYLCEFRSTFRQYDGCKFQIDFTFSVPLYGQTYDDVEAGYFQWKRMREVTWRAYKSAADLRQHFPEDDRILGLRLVGARHFTRLHSRFGRMILQYEPEELSRDWIESVASHLCANSSDFDDMEKTTREILRTVLCQTFPIRICWLTQVHSYLLDSFSGNV